MCEFEVNWKVKGLENRFTIPEGYKYIENESKLHKQKVENIQGF
jgi:hypothetical protein